MAGEHPGNFSAMCHGCMAMMVGEGVAPARYVVHVREPGLAWRRLQVWIAEGLTVAVGAAYVAFVVFLVWAVERVPVTQRGLVADALIFLGMVLLLAVVVRGLLDRWRRRTSARAGAGGRWARRWRDEDATDVAGGRGGRGGLGLLAAGEGRPATASSAACSARRRVPAGSSDPRDDPRLARPGGGPGCRCRRRWTATVLAGTQQPIGRAPGSYVTGKAPSANPLFPPEGNPEWLPPDGMSTYAGLRLEDRAARVDEAEARASAVTADDLAAPARLDGFVTRTASRRTIMEGSSSATRWRSRRPASSTS